MQLNKLREKLVDATYKKLDQVSKNLYVHIYVCV